MKVTVSEQVQFMEDTLNKRIRETKATITQIQEAIKTEVLNE